MKKIIEVKRGDPVPDNARWLKDFQKVVREWEEMTGHELQNNPFETMREWATFDVFEVSIEEKNESKVPVKGQCEDCGEKDYGHVSFHTSECPRNPF